MRHATPAVVFGRLREDILRAVDSSAEREDLFARVNYYNKLTPGIADMPGVPLGKVDRSKSRYFIDLQEYLKYFPQSLRVDYCFGDVTWVPEVPSVVKSRPVAGENRNSVVLNLDKLRHFQVQRDAHPWSSKLPRAVWRGSLNNPLRAALVARHRDSRFADVGHIGAAHDGIAAKPFLSPADQLAYRYILSIEGCDVATNLKWIMASGSLCLMPKSRYETWFMEGRLQPGRHFIEVRDDFADLEEKIDMLESTPALAAEVVHNANRYVATFRSRARERLTSLLVLQKYFEATGQLPASAYTARFFA
ncbi:glycosyl transferase family 90 [Shinella zoogloeoides]|uniref:Glycosyl transferase CAP10 domain-containing protein n=1 Tax=Shinella zoogloeoides TaxID=352475 RepID=A0A6N8T9S7_SHIZO|nr:glycosyl transferase family 90 [Shinella zoogloeoides]MXN99976.1 hypothetical protein [Shinella zoogloeoides]UEX82318.1 lipopolysaccharide biosynthesis protein [Shinella zoogloeoides]